VENEVASREPHEFREKGKMRYIDEAYESCNLRDSQTSKIIIHSEKLVLGPKFSQDSRVKLVMILASLAT
jgi:hypothetical protein